MIKIYELNDGESIIDKNLNESTPIAITDLDIEMNHAIKIKDQTYTIVCMGRKGTGEKEYAIVEKIDISNNQEELYSEDEITCPYCNEPITDSFEYPDYEEKFECQCCGSIFSYEREVSVTYDMKLIKAGKIIAID